VLLTRLGISVDPESLGDLTVSMLQGAHGALGKEIHKLVRFIADELRPEIVNLPNSLLIALAPAIKAEMKIPVCCTLQGEDLFLSGLGDTYRKEAVRIIRENAAHVDAFIAVSHFGAASMADFLEIDRNRIHVVPLGMDFSGFKPPKIRDAGPFTIGYLARITKEKGLHQLCDAYRVLRSRCGNASSRLWAAGYMAREHKSYLDGIKKNLDSWGLANQFRYHGELNRSGKIEFLNSLTVFSVPESYAEPKGLFLLEAMASGIPVVQPRRGAFTEILEKTGGGILVEPDNPEALAEGILELWKDPARRIKLGESAFRNVRLHYSISQMTESTLSVYRSVLESHRRNSPGPVRPAHG
jgi:glycosyltransferase involved in cell wall biosynthesis